MSLSPTPRTSAWIPGPILDHVVSHKKTINLYAEPIIYHHREGVVQAYMDSWGQDRPPGTWFVNLISQDETRLWDFPPSPFSPPQVSFEDVPRLISEP
jgi:hypothetical protein